jgi:hypothetical protein
MRRLVRFECSVAAQLNNPLRSIRITDLNQTECRFVEPRTTRVIRRNPPGHFLMSLGDTP